MKRDFLKILKEKRLKATKARIAILSVFSDQCLPLSAEEVYQRLSKSKAGRSIDQATVYRSLKSFEEVGMVERLNLHKDVVTYELPINHHHHIICKKCGYVEELKDCQDDVSLQKIQKSAKNFKQVFGHSLEFFGLCKKCAVI